MVAFESVDDSEELRSRRDRADRLKGSRGLENRTDDASVERSEITADPDFVVRFWNNHYRMDSRRRFRHFGDDLLVLQ